MTLTEILLFVIVCCIVIVMWQLSSISSFLKLAILNLQSLDKEVFHLSQEQNPNYGQCDNCGTRGLVRHVVPVEHDDTDDDELFYCKACWWMSDTAEVSDEEKYHKDRMTERDKLAERIGPR